MSAALRVVVERGDSGPVVVARGELDIATAPSLTAALSACDERDDVTVDLRGVAFMDCSGVRCLLEANQRKQRRLSVIAAGRVRDLLELTGVQRRLRVKSAGRPVAVRLSSRAA